MSFYYISLSNTSSVLYYQIKILEFIISFKSSFGYSPSIREIAKGVGLASTSTVHSHLKKLEFLGYVKRN
ncbi:MAG: hypothetical protein ACRCXT_01175 [Paraclostridium sp.]